MNAQNLQDKPKVLKESKNKIKVDFERTDAKTRFKEKYISFFFLTKVVWFVFRLVLLVGISYIVLYPFFTKVAGSFMAPEDFVDVTVRLIPKNWTLDTYKGVLTELNYWEAFGNTLLLSGSCALLQTFVCATIGYGFAKYKFKANGLIFLLVMLTMIVPHQTLELSLFMKFRYFDLFGILSFFSGGASVGIEAIDNILGSIKILPWANGINLCNSYWPLLILSATGLAFKNGLYVFMLRQFFRGIPDSLEESAYIDGASNFRTFIQIVLPMSVPMLITVFLFSFCWQWTDNFYTELFFTTTKTVLMPDIIDIPKSLKTDYAGQSLYYAAIRNTCGLCIIAPLVILYLFGQRYLVEGIERSGLTAE
jgi:multiple sugar transport system permease protein